MADAQRHCEDCGGNVHLSTLLPGRWMHDDAGMWAGHAHPVRLREESGPVLEPEAVVVLSLAPEPVQPVETEPHNEGSPVDVGQQLFQLAEFLQRADGGRLVLVFNSGEGVWTGSCEFGREAEDSNMAGGAAYSIGATVETCVAQLAQELRLDVPS